MNHSGGGLVTKLCLTLATPWTVTFQAPLSIGFHRKEYWSRLPFPSPNRTSKVGDITKRQTLTSPEGKSFHQLM